MITTRGRDLNHVASLYDPVIEILSFGREQRFRDLSLEHMAIRPDDRILDIGCGTGTLTLLAAKHLTVTGNATGIDAATKMIAIARNKAEQQGIPARFEHAVAEALPFNDSAFTLVVSSMFCHHIDLELKRLAFREMLRVLAPGGRLVCADIDRPTTILGWLTGWTGRWLLLQPELADNLRGLLPNLIEEAGFIAVRRVAHVHGLISVFTAI
ncbi:MAG: methyltransferase domain-containing protein, partial [Desulfobulbaceae bacterium]|nr:methyltransferase domain-containing protein [Desulfobulbaceae bacterium]